MADSLSMNIPAAAFINISSVVMLRQYGMQLTMQFTAFFLDRLKPNLIYLF